MNRSKLLLVAFLGVFAFVTIAGVFMLVLAIGRGGDLGLGGRIALVEIDGVLLDDEELLRQLRQLREDPTVRGFVVSINSPGGVVAPSQSIYGALRSIRDEDDLPVIASISGVGASGGYYVALAADSIYALPGSITGSIGVIMEFPDASELMDRIGFAMQTVQSSDHKDIGSPFRPMTEEDRALLASLVDDVYDQFVDAVATERGIPRERVLEMADGRLFSGRQALRAGLIDAEGNIEAAVAAAGRMAGLGDDPHVVRPPEPSITLFDLLLQAGTRIGAGWRSATEAAAVPSLRFMPGF